MLRLIQDAQGEFEGDIHLYSTYPVCVVQLLAADEKAFSSEAVGWEDSYPCQFDDKLDLCDQVRRLWRKHLYGW